MKKITVNLTDDAFAAMEAAQFSEALSATDVINRSLFVYSALAAVPPGAKSRLEISNGNETVWRVVEVEGGGAP